MFNKLCLVILLTVLNFSILFSQKTFSERVVQGLGASVLSDVAISPIKTLSYYNPDAYNSLTGGYGVTTYDHNQSVSVALVAYNYMLQINAVEISDNLSVSFLTQPSAGFTVGNYGLGAITFPFFANFSFGAGSTTTASSDRGGYVGIGYELLFAPIFHIDAENSHGDLEITRFWHQPAVNVGYRYWNKADKMNQIGLLMGFKDASSGVVDISSTLSPKAMHIRLSFVTFLNY